MKYRGESMMPDSPHIVPPPQRFWHTLNGRLVVLALTAVVSAGLLLVAVMRRSAMAASAPESPDVPVETARLPELDRDEYDRRMRVLAHAAGSAEAPTEAQGAETARPAWPVRDAAYPSYGALLPFNRIVAYYGNFYSRGMGVLGEYPSDVLAERLMADVKRWEEADPATPVVPAVDYIAAVAQGSAGRSGTYSARMPDGEIAKALDLARRVNGIVILEVQPGFADILGEVRALDPYLSLPQVHLAIDPEFAMIRSGSPPGTVVGTVDASEINAVARHLADLVRDHALPPKVLIVHRYTGPMVTNAPDIVPLPEVQVVMDMDGWGTPRAKLSTYESHVASEPVQFTGFKIFYKNDLRSATSRLLGPQELLDLTPSPSYIQYQ